MAKHRSFRLAETMKEEVSRIIREEMKDPRLGFVTITGVEVEKDLRYARIFVSILGDEQEIKESMKVLERAVGYIRSELGKILQVRYTPEIVFKYDRSIQYGAHISQILREVGTERDTDHEQEE